MRRPLVLPYSFVLLLVGACATGHEVARKGRQLILGMDASTLQDCAGIPTRTKQLDPRTELYSYENHYEHSRSRSRLSAEASRPAAAVPTVTPSSGSSTAKSSGLTTLVTMTK